MAESQQIPEPYNVHAWLVRPAKPRTTLTGITVVPTSFVASAATVGYALNFTLATTLPADGKILVEFDPGYEFGTLGASSTEITGTFVLTRSGQVVTVTRQNDGTTDIGAVDLTITGITNPAAGSYNLKITTQDTDSVVIDGPGSSPNFSIGGLHTLSAALSNTTAREYSDYTFTFTAVTALPADGKVVLTFPWQTTFGPSPLATSTTIGGGFTVTTSENIATITRDGTGASETGVSDIKLTKVLNLSADTYVTQVTIQNAAGAIQSGPAKTTGYAVGTVADNTFTQKLKLDVMEGLWDWREDGGSSKAEFTLGQVLEDPQTYINNEWEIILDIRVEPEREYTRWYRGNLVNVDTRSIGGKTVSVVQCNGAWATQANKARVEKDYTAGTSDVQALIKDVIQSGGIPNESTILYDSTKIASATYTPTTFDARGSAAHVIETLAQIQGQTTYKVNPADRKIYTAAKTLTVQERNIYIIGKNAQEVHYGSGRNHLINMFTLIGRNNSGLSPTVVRGDEEAVTEYGTRNKTVILPYLSDTDDLQRWADKRIEEAKTVRGYSVVRIPDVQKRVESDTASTGNVRVWGTKVDQESEFVDLPLYKVQYRYGLSCARYEVPDCTPEETRQPSRSIEATIWIGIPPPNIPEWNEINELDKERITEWIEQGRTPDGYDGVPTTANRPQDRTWDGQLTLDRTNEDLYLWDGTTEDYIRIGGKNVAFLDEAPTFTGDITISNADPSLKLVDTTGASDDWSVNVDASEFNITNDTDAGRKDIAIDGDGKVTIDQNLAIKSGTANAMTFDHAASATRTVTFPDASITVARNDAAQTFTGLQTFGDGVATDTIAEKTAAAGVTVDGCLIKDGIAANAGLLDGLDSLAFLKADGTVALTGNLTVSAGGTIDGYDLGVTLLDTPRLSTNNTFTGQQTFQATNPIFIFHDGGGGVDNRRWWFQVTDDFDPGGKSFFMIRGANDADSAAVQALAIRRSGQTVDWIQLNAAELFVADGAKKIGDSAGNLYQQGTLVALTAVQINDAALKSAANTFTADQTLSGASADRKLNWSRSGDVTASAIAYIESAGNLLFGATSNNALRLLANNTEYLRILAAGNIGMAATKKLFLDGVGGAGDTYLLESSDNVVELRVNDISVLKAKNNGITAKGGLVVPLCFIEDGIPATAEFEAKPVAGSSTLEDPNVEYVMPFSGSIVGIGVAASEPRTAGTATYIVSKNTFTTGFSVALNATDDQYAYDDQPIGTDTFVAGDRIGCRLTISGGSFTPTTMNVQITVYVEFDTTGIA